MSLLEKISDAILGRKVSITDERASVLLKQYSGGNPVGEVQKYQLQFVCFSLCLFGLPCLLSQIELRQFSSSLRIIGQIWQQVGRQQLAWVLSDSTGENTAVPNVRDIRKRVSSESWNITEKVEIRHGSDTKIKLKSE